MTRFRSALFSTAFIIVTAILCVLGMPLLVAPQRAGVPLLRFWTRLTQWMLELICGISFEVRGRDNIPSGAAIVAAKHQSAWETLNLMWILSNPSIIYKKELGRIPIFGLFMRTLGNLAIDRSGGAKALRALIVEARAIAASGRPIIIFPEGTRRAPGAPPAYQRGIIALYRGLGVSCVPVALNSGLTWPPHGGPRGPGHIIVEFLPAIAPGLDGDTFLAELQERIETATDRLLTSSKGVDQFDAAAQ